MELVIKGLVLCLIALAGVYHADAFTTISGAGTKPEGTPFTLTCDATIRISWKQTAPATSIRTITSSTDAAKYTVTGGTLKFLKPAVSDTGSYTCEKTGFGAVGPGAAVVLTIEATTTTATTMAPTTAKTGSGAEGINGLPLAVMIFTASSIIF